MHPDTERLFADALAKVESKSIREWASTGKNRNVFVMFVDNNLSAGNPGKLDAEKLCVLIVSNAIGL